MSRAIWMPLSGFAGAWCAERLGPGGVPLRAVALRLADGTLAIYSPLRGLGEEAHRELAALGAPSALIAPNHFHNLGLAEHAARYPTATIFGAATAAPRLKRRAGHAVRDAATLMGAGAWAAGSSLLIPPATRNGELWVSLAAPAGHRAWIVGDAFFNIARTPRSPLGLLLRALGITPGLRIGASFLWMIKDRAAYRAWLLAALAAQGPTTLVPCHGEILTDRDLATQLRVLTEARV
jgi:hypothetical protein